MPEAIQERSAGGWRNSLATYTDKRMLQVLLLYFSSGLPYLLTYTTLSAWLSTATGVRLRDIAVFTLVATPYIFKFAWAPLLDRLPPPIPIGRRRGWGITIQILLMAAIFLMATSNPKAHLLRMAVFATIVAFLAATQDIVIDAWRVEILPAEMQGSGAAILQVGYRIGMLAAGAGALVIADHYGWFAAYATMAMGLLVGILVFAFGPEPAIPPEAVRPTRGHGVGAVTHWFSTAVAGPFADFMKRPLWLVILIFVAAYKLGEGMAGVMSTPLYIRYLHFSLSEIAAVSKVLGVVSIFVGAFIGGVVTARYGILRSLMICGILQSAGNLFYVLQAVGGHKIVYLALCVSAENLTSAMAGTALIAYLSSLCSPAFTATQYALLSSLASLGVRGISSTGGSIVEHIGWANFFLFTSVVNIPSLLLLIWIMRRGSVSTPSHAVPEPASSTP